MPGRSYGGSSGYDYCYDPNATFSVRLRRPVYDQYAYGSGMPSTLFTFKQLAVPQQSSRTRFQQLMVDECRKHGMKPVQDEGANRDTFSLWIGNQRYISHPYYRNYGGGQWMPRGFNQIRERFRGLCLYGPPCHSPNTLPRLALSHSLRSLTP